MTRYPRFPLGQQLVAEGTITPPQLAAALSAQQTTRDSLGHILIQQGALEDEAALLPFVARQWDVPRVALADLDIPRAVIDLIPVHIAAFYALVPVSHDDTCLTIAITRPGHAEALDAVGTVFPGPVRVVVAGGQEIADAIRRYYGVGAATLDRMAGSALEQGEVGPETADLTVLNDEASIGNVINQILLEAHRDGATDIHIEPADGHLRVRYRVDGILRDAQAPAGLWAFRDSLVSRIKILSNLNIAERRLPQDGRFKVRAGDTDLDLRASFLPTPHGEGIVLRLLSSTKLYSLTDLGLSGPDLQTLDTLLGRTHGIIFVTGPTGSGKTTTLYSCLAKLNTAQRKIITIEDPIEYQLAGTTQIQVHPAIGLSFASGLRSMLRHDPDVMMVGEVRDRETAEIAVQIALTGHLVFSTLHTNDAAGGVTRLIDMGVEPYLVSSSVECFIAQRLVRTLCPKCKHSVPLPPAAAADFGLSPQEAKGVTVYAGRGCAACRFTGYRGRVGIYEFLKLDDTLRRLIMAHAPAPELKAAALKAGMRTMLADGWQKVRAGITTPEEVIRVTRDDVPESVGD